MRLKLDSMIVALTLIRFGQELGAGGRVAPLVAEAIDTALRLLGGVR
jgi:hypothetical protein